MITVFVLGIFIALTVLIYRAQRPKPVRVDVRERLDAVDDRLAHGSYSGPCAG